MASTELITIEQVEDVLLHGGAVPIVDSDEIQADIVRQILASESIEQAFGEFNTTSVKDIEGVPIEVHGIAWAKSAFDQGPGIYALLRVRMLDGGQEYVVSMGGRTTMARFVWAMRQDAMPIRGAFEYEQSNANPERKFLTFKLAPAKVRAA